MQRAFNYRFSNIPNGENDDEHLEAFARDKILTHMLFLFPHLQNAGIMPLILSWIDPSFKHRSEKINSYHQVIELVEQEHPIFSPFQPLPHISASFDDKRIDLEFEELATYFGLPNYGVKILNRDEDGTLEDVLERTKQIVF